MQQLAEKFKTLRFDIASQKIQNRNPFGLPNRLWEFMLNYSGIKQDIRWTDLSSKEANKLIKNLCNGEFHIKGKTTFKEEFVTAGGISLNEIDYNTMMSKKVSNLFFAGEIMDVDGVLPVVSIFNMPGQAVLLLQRKLLNQPGSIIYLFATLVVHMTMR